MDPTKLMYTVLAGKATKEEIIQLDEWISRSEENREEFNNIKLLHESLNEVAITENDHADDGFQKIKVLIHKRSLSRKKRKVVLVSVVVLLLLFVLFLFLLYKAEKKEHLIKFENASLESVINVLEQEYQIHVEASPESIQPCWFTGTFYKASALEVIKTIALNFKLEYEVVGDHEFRLKGKGC